MTSSVHTPVKERVRLYLGTGCGKTTATFGLALRALSRGKNVTIIFFDKLEDNTSEGKALDILSQVSQPGFGKLNVHYTGVNRVGAGPNGTFRFYSSPNGILPEDREESRKGLNWIREAIDRGDEVVIADEMLDVARVGVLNWDEVRPVIESRRDPTLLVMTGRKAPDWLMNDATTISTTVQLKHHGRALEGIDC
jgi:cob(I)alamin adenosyltransferase